MTRETLEKELKKLEFQIIFIIWQDREKRMSVYVWKKIGDKWSVYYLERGVKTTNEIFDTENDACQFLYAELMD